MAQTENTAPVSLRKNNTNPSASQGQGNNVWEVHEDLDAKCARHDRPNTVCCRDLKDDDERSLLNPDLVRDIIIGVADGLTVPFALTAGLSSLGSSRLVVVAGLAELVSGAISMGIGGYLSAEAERDHYLYMRRTTRNRVMRSCEGEMQREVAKVLQPYGIDEKLSARIALKLLNIEHQLSPEHFEDNTTRGVIADWLSNVGRNASNAAQSAGNSARANERTRLLPSTVQDLATSSEARDELNQEVADAAVEAEAELDPDSGLTAFLLKFSEEVEEVDETRALTSAVVIGTSYFLAGLIPLVPYFFIELAYKALFFSVIITTITLLLFGSFKTYFSGAEVGVRGYIKGCLSTLAVGGAASAASFIVVRGIEGVDNDKDNSALI